MIRISASLVAIFLLGALAVGVASLVETKAIVDAHTETCRVTSIAKWFDEDENARLDKVLYRCPSFETSQWLYGYGQMGQGLEKLREYVPLMGIGERFECTVVRMQGNLTGLFSPWTAQSCKPTLPQLHGLP